jgi:ATP-dependent Clp protease ATP-binding subunit ClpC
MNPETPICELCGERPGTVPVMLTNGVRRSHAVLCDQCAAQTVGAGQQAQQQRAQQQQQPAAQQSALDEFGRDLTQDARASRIDPVIGRDEEIAQTIEILARRRKNNAVLIGEAGVGKTAIAEGLARRIAEGDVPETLRDTRLVSLDLASMIAGSQYRGQFEQRLKGLLKEVIDSEGKVVLFIDELHTVLGAGAAEGAMDAANILKPLLARGELRLVGATTLGEYRKIERDSALARRFSPVTVDEPTVEQTVQILRGLREVYAFHHDAEITDEALVAAARLSDRYVTEYHLPDKAIDLIDQAAAKVRMHVVKGDDTIARLRAELEKREAEKEQAVHDEAYEDAAKLKEITARLRQQLADLGEQPEPAKPVVGEREVAAVIAARTAIPVGELVAGETERLVALEDDLHQRVVGQDAAVATVADTIRRARVGLSEDDRPLGTFLFLGPTGVGKTELVKALSERMFASEKALVRIDMSEFREPHTVARLIGSPPGYVGYGEGGQLTEPVRRRPYSVVLLDEVEKAHPDVWNVLLALMDDGRLTDGEGRTVDFTNAVVVMTSNLGAGAAKRSVGFTAAQAAPDDERMLAAAKSAFLPEFLNRIDEIVTFRPLDAEQVQEITGLIIDRVAQRLRTERGIELEVEPALVARLAREGFDAEYGARPLQRHVRRTLERELTRAILDGTIADGDRVVAADGPDGLTLRAPLHLVAAA